MRLWSSCPLPSNLNVLRFQCRASKPSLSETEMILQDLEDRKATEAELKREREERAATAAVKAAKKAAAADSDVE